MSAGRAAAALLAVLAGAAGCDHDGLLPKYNRAPWPPVLSGPDSTRVGLATGFQVTAADPDGDRLVVYVAWGDGDTADYGDFVPSGATVSFTHTWGRPGTFLVSAGCYDVRNPNRPLVSAWSSPRPVVVRVPGPRLTAAGPGLGFPGQ